MDVSPVVSPTKYGKSYGETYTTTVDGRFSFPDFPMPPGTPIIFETPKTYAAQVAKQMPAGFDTSALER